MIDRIDPSEETQFTPQGTPPSVAVADSGKRVPEPATSKRCVTPKTATDREGVAPRLPAKATSAAILSIAGEHRGREGALHRTVDEFE